MVKRLRITIGLLFLGSAALADDSSVPIGNKLACLEGPMAEFGQYIGNWKISDSQLSQDGTWVAGAGARWNFICLGDGTAIQDFWMPTNGPIGTNLRTYNSDSQSWDIAWAVKGVPGFAHIGAKLDDAGNIVMRHKTKIPDPLRRITFYPAANDAWKWTLEISSDDGESWLEVYRIQATRSP